MRQWQEKILPWPDLKNGQSYPVQVSNIEKLPKEQTIRITVHFQGKQMRKRRLCFSLTLPIRPDGIAADFFGACGISVAANMKISPRQALGKVLHVQFEKGPDGAYQPTCFEAIHQETVHEPPEY